jgi:hypothetical protein
VALRLVGSDGTSWAERIGEPCNGRCATTEWRGEAVLDRQALYVPPDVPPGDYSLRLAWLTPEGHPLMGWSADEVVPQVHVPLMQVQVGPPAEPLPNAPPSGKLIDATLAPGLSLRGVGFKDAAMGGGEPLTIPLQWEVSSSQPALDARLVLESDTQRFILSEPLGPGWYPSVEWRPGQIVRAQPQFLLPGTVPPGTYRVDLAVAKTGDPQVQGQLELGKLAIHDRPRRYDVRTEGEAVDAAWQEGIQLVRIVAPREGSPGNTIPIAPVWRAGGPTTASWKVFIHLLDSEGNIRAQSDGYLAGGRALTPTWQRDEVLVDAHPLSLPATLPGGDCSLRIGFYDERSGRRLLRADGSESLTLPLLLRVVD